MSAAEGGWGRWVYFAIAVDWLPTGSLCDCSATGTARKKMDTQVQGTLIGGVYPFSKEGEAPWRSTTGTLRGSARLGMRNGLGASRRDVGRVRWMRQRGPRNTVCEGTSCRWRWSSPVGRSPCLAVVEVQGVIWQARRMCWTAVFGFERRIARRVARVVRSRGCSRHGFWPRGIEDRSGERLLCGGLCEMGWLAFTICTITHTPC